MKRRSVLAIVALVAALFGVPSSPAAATITPGSCIDNVPALAKAPMLPSDLSPAGTPVLETKLADGRSSIPVIMVHGFTASSAHDTNRKGSFSQIINKTAVKGTSADLSRSLIGVIQDAGGATVYTFDYHDASARWVTDGQIGPKLAEAIACLAKAHGHPAMMVVHSMGGLATRLALSIIGSDTGKYGPVESNVSDVITFGTPNTGSWLASVVGAANSAAAYGPAFPGASGVTVAAVRSMVTACGVDTTKSMANPGVCGLLGPQISSARSQAGKALQIGSAEMNALPPWPHQVTVQALGGDTNIEIPRYRWFNTSIAVGSIGVGDFVVGTESARGGAALSYTIRCDYTLDLATTTEDNILEAFQLKSAGETRDNVYTNALASPCFHGNLMQTIELSNIVLATIAELVDEQNALLNRWTIGFNGIGPFTIDGTAWSELRSEQGFVESPSTPGESTVCAAGGWYESETDNDGVSMLATNTGSTPDRIDVVGLSTYGSRAGTPAAIASTAEGIGLGSSEADVQAAYPSASSAPMQLSPDHTEFQIENGSGRGMKILTLSGTVVDISVGNVPDVFSPEGCA